jgi:mRNA interferase RelE/StbE
MKVVIRKSALKALERKDAKMRKRFFEAFEQIAAGKADKLEIQKLVGRTGFRLRIGQYRALFTQDLVLLNVLDVGPRGGIYKD